MNPNHFQKQIDRLSAQFGAQHYKAERVKLYWRKFQYFSDSWMERSVNKFIEYSRVAPLMQEFEAEMALEREKNYDSKKTEHTRDAKEFMASYPAEDIQTICAQIRDRIQGRMSDSNFTGFKKMLTPPAEYFRCKRCEDKNVSTDELGAATICGCRPLT